VSVVLATASLASTWWAYVLLFLAVTASWAGVPAIGSAAVAAAAVAASQGNLNLAAVIITASIAGEVGGVIGYSIGNRWGTQILARPGKRQAGRQRLMERGERAYARWGRLAVFFTPAIISGTARMQFNQFVVWNFLASTCFALSMGLTSYGVGRLATGHHSAEDILILITGVAAGAFLVFVVVRRHRRHRAARSERERSA
jgi:membrane protein DedA with SNARE-associated domain